MQTINFVKGKYSIILHNYIFSSIMLLSSVEKLLIVFNHDSMCVLNHALFLICLSISNYNSFIPQLPFYRIRVILTIQYKYFLTFCIILRSVHLLILLFLKVHLIVSSAFFSPSS